jgi:hypothetical protein
VAKKYQNMHRGPIAIDFRTRSISLPGRAEINLTDPTEIAKAEQLVDKGHLRKVVSSVASATPKIPEVVVELDATVPDSPGPPADVTVALFDDQDSGFVSSPEDAGEADVRSDQPDESGEGVPKPKRGSRGRFKRKKR